MALSEWQQERIRKWWPSPVSGYRLKTYYVDDYPNAPALGRGFTVFVKVVDTEGDDVGPIIPVGGCTTESKAEAKVAEIEKFITMLDEQFLDEGYEDTTKQE